MIRIYMCVCVCVRVCEGWENIKLFLVLLIAVWMLESK
jgi:hypothetical protein